jgi:hypothetical protein
LVPKLQENLQELGFYYCKPADIPICLTSVIDKAIWSNYRERIIVLWSKIWNLLTPFRFPNMMDRLRSALVTSESDAEAALLVSRYMLLDPNIDENVPKIQAVMELHIRSLEDKKTPLGNVALHLKALDSHLQLLDVQRFAGK